MQQRFCQCGHKLWVEYVFSREDFLSVFRVQVGNRGGDVKFCPRCGRRLDIDELN